MANQQTKTIYQFGRITLAVLFIGSGLIPLLLSDPIERLQLLHHFPFPVSWHQPLFYGLVLMDISCGMLALLYPSRFIWCLMLIIVLGYTITMTIFTPEIWRDPFSGMLKNFPILFIIWLMRQLEER